MNLTPFHGPPAVPPSVPGFAAHTLLGFGAHGEVWLAEDLSNGAQVALKIGRRPGPEPNVAVGPQPGRLLSSVGAGHFADGALERETALLCRIDHPHIVRLQRVVPLDDGRLAMVLDLATGGSLASLIAARGRFDPGEVSTLLIPLAGALEHLHRLGLVHGDISPGNVLFTGDGRPQLGDLGVARVLGSRAEEVWATPGFADPALNAGGAVDQQAADVWGLAAVAWFALTGGLPALSGESQVELFGRLERDQGDQGDQGVQGESAGWPGQGDQSDRPGPGGRADHNGQGGRADRAGGLAELLARCLATDPAGRPGLAELADSAWQVAQPVPVRLVGERPEISSEAGLPSISRQVTRQVAHRIPAVAQPAAGSTPARPAIDAEGKLRSGKGGLDKDGPGKRRSARGGLGKGAPVRSGLGRGGLGRGGPGRGGPGRRGAQNDESEAVRHRPSGVPLRWPAKVGRRSRGISGRQLAGAVTVTVAVVLLGALAIGLTSSTGLPGRAHRAEAVAGGAGVRASRAGSMAELTAELGQALVEIGRSRAGAFATASSTGLANADQVGSPAYLADDALIQRLRARGVRLQGVRYQVEQVRVIRRVGTAVEVAAVVTTSGHRQVATSAAQSEGAPLSAAVPVDGPRRMVFTVVPLGQGLVGPARWRVQSVRAA